jgi:hypothetical protein
MEGDAGTRASAVRWQKRRTARAKCTNVLGEASYGNVVLSCGLGNHVGRRGLPGRAEGTGTAMPLPFSQRLRGHVRRSLGRGSDGEEIIVVA